MLSKNHTYHLWQKEFRVIRASDKRSGLSTCSVRGCYAVSIYHLQTSALLHWDDNTQHAELYRFIEICQKKGLVLDKSATVTLIGGWEDDLESKKSGDFLLNYFKQVGVRINTKYFQVKKASDETDKQQGFALVALNAKTGKIYISDNWKKHPLSIEPSSKAIAKVKTIQWIDATHLQMDEHSNSGGHLIDHAHYKRKKKQEAKQLSLAVKANDIEKVSDLLEHAVVHINTISGKKHRTALHRACRRQFTKIASLLVLHGADLFQRDNNNQTPYQSIKPSAHKQELLAVYQYLRLCTQDNYYNLRIFSIFSRTPERLSFEELTQIKTIKKYLSDPKNYPKINQEFNQILGDI